MNGNELVLDTSIVIDNFKKNDQVVSAINKATMVYVPATVLGELYLGAYRSINRQVKNEEIEAFLLTCQLLKIEQTTSAIYAEIKADLLNKGRPIPDNDIWIAATALQYSLPLFTADRHFREIDGLQLFNPLTSI